MYQVKKAYDANACNEEKVSSFVPADEAQREVYERIVIDIFNRKKKTGTEFLSNQKNADGFWEFLLVFGRVEFLRGARVNRAETMRAVDARASCRAVGSACRRDSALIASFTGERALFPQSPIGHAFQTPVA